MSKLHFYIRSIAAKSAISIFSLFVLLSPLIITTAKAGGITNIKEIINNTPLTMEVRKFDTKPLAAAAEYETTGEIPADGGTWSGDMWIPWVDNSNDFTEKRMEVRVEQVTNFWIWQSGEFVRFNSRARFVSNAPRVSGESRSGGERRLIISMDVGRVVFKFERL